MDIEILNHLVKFCQETPHGEISGGLVCFFINGKNKLPVQFLFSPLNVGVTFF